MNDEKSFVMINNEQIQVVYTRFSINISLYLYIYYDDVIGVIFSCFITVIHHPKYVLYRIETSFIQENK